MKFTLPRKWETERKEEERGKKIQGYTSRWMKNEIKYSIWSSPCQENEKQKEKEEEREKYKDTQKDELKIKKDREKINIFDVYLPWIYLTRTNFTTTTTTTKTLLVVKYV